MRSYLERDFWAAGYRTIAGVDEVGRGCLAGPLVAAAVVLPKIPWPRGSLIPSAIRDSKKLSPQERLRLYPLIVETSLAWSLSVITAEMIDSMNIFRASLKAMREAAQGVTAPVDLVLVDGPWSLNLKIKEETLIHGDDRSLNIGAASIIAKVTRDRMMEDYGRAWPSFSFAAHKGYGTQDHLREIKRHGLTPLHRRSFAPCQARESFSFSQTRSAVRSPLKIFPSVPRWPRI